MDKLFNPFSIEGKTIMLTGASSGIGRQCAIDCAKMGAKVIAIGRNKERLECVRAEMGGQGICYSYDLEDIEGIKSFLTSVVKDNGKLDGFIHAAGIEVTSPVKLTGPNDYERLYRINCLSAFEFIKYFSDFRVFNKDGSVVMISSISGIIARKGLSAYAASKGAMMSAAKVMAVELSSRNIRVNTVSPGTILTPMMQSALDAMKPEEREKRVAGFPLGLGQTTDISYACIYLMSDASRWVTGQNIIIDGGYTAQ